MNKKLPILTIVLAAMLAACSSESASDEWSMDNDQQSEGDRLRLGACMTRSADVAVSDGTRLEFFLTSSTASARHQFTYNADADQWSSNALVYEEQTYHVFGYMPAQDVQSASIAPIASSFDYGAVLTLNGLPVVTSLDVCFVTGVKSGTGVTTVRDIADWNYLYVGQEEGANYINLALDHLFAGLSLSFRVDEKYALLRTIKLKRVQLQPSVTSLVNVSITQLVGLPSTMTFTATDTPSAAVCELFSSTDGETLTAEPSLSVSTNILPHISGLTLLSTYDVYDKAGNCIRQDCMVENKLEDVISQERGSLTNLTLTIAPTYLYILSDADLNNPVVNVEN